MAAARGLRASARVLAAAWALAGCRRAPPPEPPPPTPHIDWARLTESRPTSGNLIANGGFEAGLAPWFAPTSAGWAPGEVVTTLAHGGAASLLARVRGAAGSTPERRWGAMFEVGTVPFPRHVSLWYRVERWDAADALQYLLFAVLVRNGTDTYQLRYFLAGPQAIPYNEKGNVRFVLVQPGAPALGRWIRFTTDLHRDFQQHWGRVPENFEALRFAVEARFDTRDRPLARDVTADVYFDDVYVGFSPPSP